MINTNFFVVHFRYLLLWSRGLILPRFHSLSNFGDNSLNNEKQSKDGGEMDRSDMDMDRHNESHDMNDDHGASYGSDGGNGGGVAGGKNDTSIGGGGGGADTSNRTDESPAKLTQEERPFPRIQIKSPSKLAQEFNEKQKQSDANDAAAAAAVAASAASSINENNRTNNNKSSVDMNTTPLYDEPTEDRSYSLKEAPTSHSFASENHETSLSHTDTMSTAAPTTDTNNASATAAASAVTTTESAADNCDN